MVAAEDVQGAIRAALRAADRGEAVLSIEWIGAMLSTAELDRRAPSRRAEAEPKAPRVAIAEPKPARPRGARPAVKRADQLLDELSTRGGTARIMDLARALDTPRGNVENILRGLLKEGRVRRGDPGSVTVVAGGPKSTAPAADEPTRPPNDEQAPPSPRAAVVAAPAPPPKPAPVRTDPPAAGQVAPLPKPLLAAAPPATHPAVPAMPPVRPAATVRRRTPAEAAPPPPPPPAAPLPAPAAVAPAEQKTRRRLVELDPVPGLPRAAAAPRPEPPPKVHVTPEPKKEPPAAPKPKEWALEWLVEPALKSLQKLGGWRTAVTVAADLSCKPRDAGTVLAIHVERGQVERRRLEGQDAEYRSLLGEQGA